jgi:glyoxylase-like metal-dependent hydrolase (beta-lactamase superfamily II)
MRRLIVIATALLAAVAASAAEPDAVLSAQVRLGGAELKSLRFTAVGTRFASEQATSTAEPLLPAHTIQRFEAAIDFASGGLSIEQTQTTTTAGLAGNDEAGIFTQDEHSIESMSGGFAWRETEHVAGGGTGPLVAQPQPAAVLERELWLWAGTPQGVLRAAAAGTARRVAGGTEVSFTVGGRYRAKAFINDLDQVQRFETTVPDEMLGDTPVGFHYTGYRRIGSIQFPSVITESRGGEPAVYLAVTGVRPDAAVQIEVPDNVRHFSPPPMLVKSQKLAEGVYWLNGGTHHSMAVDMGDHLVVIEAPLNEARSEAVIAETKTLFPGKPIRFVINTHAHGDHAGGLRTYAAQGATVVTQTANRAYYERIWAAPWTLEPDRLARSGAHAHFMTVDDHADLKGPNGRVVSLYLLQGNPHNEQSLVVWLPAERILFQSDMLNRPMVGKSVAKPGPSVVNFYENLQRLNLNPVQIIGGHGPSVLTMADVEAATGRSTR